MRNLDISVIIPTHKRKDFLFKELEHIFQQKNVSFEVIVVNDVIEPDDTDEITSRFPQVKYIKDNRIQGPSQKHKAGVKISKGRYLYMPDDDDWLTDELFFQKAVEILDKYPSLAFVSGQTNINHQDAEGKTIRVESQVLNVSGYVDGATYLQDFQYKYNKPISTVPSIFRYQAFDELGALDMCEMSDSSLYMMALLWGDAYILNDVVAEYRILDSKTSLTYNLPVPFILNVLKQKKDIYRRGMKRLPDASQFWFQQVVITYSFFCNSSSKKNRFNVLIWIIKNMDGNVKLFRYVIAQLVRLA